MEGLDVVPVVAGEAFALGYGNFVPTDVCSRMDIFLDFFSMTPTDIRTFKAS